MSTVNSLPPEVLSIIFQFVFDSELSPSGWKPQFVTLPAIVRLLRLKTVSAEWEDVINAQTFLWEHERITLSHRQKQ